MCVPIEKVGLGADRLCSPGQSTPAIARRLLGAAAFGVPCRLPVEIADSRYTSIAEVAEQQGSSLCSELCSQHSNAIRQEEERGAVSFESRRKAIGRVGLPEVRNFRMKKLESDEQKWSLVSRICG